MDGGLGIREPIEWNSAAIKYQVWRLNQKNNSTLWSTWVHNSLLHNRFFWTTNLPSSCPWCVRKLLNARTEVIGHLYYNVGKWSRFLMWHEPWLNRTPIVSTYGHGLISIMGGSTRDAIGLYINYGVWNLSPTNHVDAINLRHDIDAVLLHDHDSVLWDNINAKPTNISTIWRSLQRPSAAPPWVDALWHPYAIPNCSFFLWLALLNRLITKDRMMQFGMTTDIKCLLCTSGSETTSHLFVECPFVERILNSCPIQLTSSWTEFLSGRFLVNPCPSYKRHLVYLYCYDSL